MPPVTRAQLEGRTIRLLGATQVITANGTYPIFTVGDVKNRAPESLSYVAYVEIEYNGGSGAVPGSPGSGRVNVGIALGTSVSPIDWKSLTSGSYSTNPTMVYAPDQANVYPNGSVFQAILTGISDSQIVIRAYGWSE